MNLRVLTEAKDGDSLAAQQDDTILGSDAALCAAATAVGKSTWDEDVICSLYGWNRFGP